MQQAVKRCSLIFLAIICLISTNARGQYKPSLNLKWETQKVFNIPESAIYDSEQNCIYVSNINGKPGVADTNGFISKVRMDGTIEKLDWVSKLNGPTGMAIYNGRLYVADITQLVVIHIATATVESVISAPGAQFLNDVAVDSIGTVYISDSNTGALYKYQNKQLSIWFSSPQLIKPNGLYYGSSYLYILEMNTGSLFTINGLNLTLGLVTKGFVAADGLARVSNDEWIISNWYGKVYSYKKGVVTMLIDTEQQRINAADLCYIPQLKLLLIPTFFDNRLRCYEYK